MNALLLTSMVALSAAPEPTPLLRDLTVEGEIGPAFIFQNDNRYGANGTEYTAKDVGEQRNLFIAKRVAVEAGLGERHTLIFLWAPFDLTTRTTLGKDINFRDQLFREGEVVDYRYLFDGYRGSYLYRVLERGRFHWDVGGSLQIRNASVEFRSVDESPSRFAVENDIGTVVAVKTRLRYDVRDNLWAMAEADLTSSFGIFKTFSGALYDVALSLGTPVRPGGDVFLRLRWLGGGANVQKRNLDNWGNFFFATAGVRADLVDLWR